MSLGLSDRNARFWLGVVFLISIFYQTGASVADIDNVRHGTTAARSPMQFGFRLEQVSGVNPEAAQAGVRWGDVLKTVEGHPFTGELVLDEILGHKRAGDPLHVELRRPDGSLFDTTIHLAPIRSVPPSLVSWVFNLAIQILLPVFCLSLGFWVAAARPYDRLAWLLLALMIGFSQFVEGFSWSWPGMPLAIVWNAALGFPFGIWLLWLVLFAFFFPTRIRFDQRHPWVKWIILAPLFAQATFFFAFSISSDYNFAWMYPFRPLLNFLLRFPLHTYLSFAAISTFFALIWIQGAQAIAPDARRRLRILYFGTATSLTPMFIAAIISVISGNDIMHGFPQWALITTLVMLLLFPVTLAYVIVVQRAMAVGVVIRQGLKYALARKGLAVFRSIIVALAVWGMVTVFDQKHSGAFPRVISVLVLALVLIARKRYYERLSQWIDRGFFREAYSAEIVMSELAEQTRQFTEAGPLLGTVAHRVSDTLHISRIAVFVRDQDRFCVTETVGIEPMPVACLSPQGRSIGLLSAAKKPELVYFDDPRSWVHGAEIEEQQKLRSLSAEVLLALPGRNQLLGLIALGPKLSEEPYSPSDLRLLQSVAIQTGFALENTQLLATVAQEAGQRERINRELEIAREVQERLFPQTCPPVPGLDYFGCCRPALAVGGDYYDYIPRQDGRIGIALGDVSGKGISAALMMASLQSLLRGQIAAGLEDISVLVTNTNRLLHDVSTSNRYCTFFYGEYDPATREIVYVNGGHNPPIVLRRDEVFRLEACGPVVGLIRNIRFESATFHFQPGDVFILFTDGISEAMTEEDEEWGDDRLIEAVRESRRLCAAEMVKQIMRDADLFTAGAEQHDDMTLIAVKVA